MSRKFITCADCEYHHCKNQCVKNKSGSCKNAFCKKNKKCKPCDTSICKEFKEYKYGTISSYM